MKVLSMMLYEKQVQCVRKLFLILILILLSSRNKLFRKEMDNNSKHVLQTETEIIPFVRFIFLLAKLNRYSPYHHTS